MTEELVAGEGKKKRPHDKTNKLPEKYSKPKGLVKDKGGKSIAEIQGQSNRWVEHLENPLNEPASINARDIKPPHTEHPTNVAPKTIEEIRMIIRRIKSG
ncbi:unnamed protein product [Schistosoma margrebowiei]|uniref:Uncharacterized protein n=1 Tax=Schistosoma margrebowiei TaxID=48269 RepID=A0A183MQQ0_9TREM|nr:unnamed protein product [Schistosoma margrebowiei]